MCELEKEKFENCAITTFDGIFCDKCKKDFYINKTFHLCYSHKEKIIFINVLILVIMVNIAVFAKNDIF